MFRRCSESYGGLCCVTLWALKWQRATIVSCQSGRLLFWANPGGIQLELNLAKELQSSNSSASNSQHPPRRSKENSVWAEFLMGKMRGMFLLLFSFCLSHSLLLLICIQRRVSQKEDTPTPDSCGRAVCKIYHRQHMSVLNCNDMISLFFLLFLF